VILASPGYHGTISGLLKNALDYIEDMSRDGEPYLQGRAVGAITCAFGWQAAVTTLGSLRSIVHALRGWPTPLGVCANSGQPLFDGHGRLLDPDIRQKLRILADEVVGFARVRSQARAFDVRAERAASLAA
jgi:FMN reductase